MAKKLELGSDEWVAFHGLESAVERSSDWIEEAFDSDLFAPVERPTEAPRAPVKAGRWVRLFTTPAMV